MSNLISKIYVKKRYLVFSLISIIAFIAPFIRINGNHLFLLSFDRKELHLFFTAFSTQELYLMPFVLILLFLTIFFITTLGGRVWCGWSCPQTIFRIVYRDFIQTKLLKIRKSVDNKQKEPEKGFKYILGILIWGALAMVAASNLIWYFIPPEDFFEYIKNPSEHPLVIGIVLGFTTFLIFDIVYLGEKFCVYICPYARVQSTMFDTDTVQVIYDDKRGGKIYDDSKNLIANKPENGECVGCQACVRICPTHIDIRKGMQLECINCLECADACAHVMGKFNKPSLISWTSQNATQTGEKVKLIRFRTIGYMVVISIVFVALFIVGGTKENMLLNINRATELYRIDVENNNVIVNNDYTFLFENTDKKDHSYYFEIDNKDIQIHRPQEPVKIGAGYKRKIIVSLYTDKTLANDDRKDTIFPIKIKAYAMDDKENIVVNRDSIFVYPKNVEIQKKKGR